MSATPYTHADDPIGSHATGAFWDAMTTPGHVYECRVLCKGRSGPLGLRETVSGFFDDREAFIAAVAPITGADAAGVYLTLNPVDTALFTRSPNRLASRPIAATRDADIIRRSRFLIDVDAANPADTSATSDERADALARRDDIRTWLREALGWRDAHVVTSSGNGGGLVFQIDLPNDERSRDLIRRVLQALHARFTTATAKVDISVHNASRITRVVGTVTAKGTPTDERPWRRATADYPEGAGVVTHAQLEALAAQAPRTTRPTTARATADGQATGDATEVDDYADLLAHGSPAGRRHHDMTRLAGHYLARGLSTPEVKVLLRVWADRCSPPVPYADVDSAIRDLAAAEVRKRTRPGASAEQPADKGDGQSDGVGQDAPPLTPAAMADTLRTQREALQRAYAKNAELLAAYTALYRLLLTEAYTESEKKMLLWTLWEKHHYRFGMPIPETFSDAYIKEQETPQAGLSINSFRTARQRLVADEVLIESVRQPGPDSTTGLPYKVITVNGERLRVLIVGLDADPCARTEERAARAAARSEEARARSDKAKATTARREEVARAHNMMAAAMGQERRNHAEETERLAAQLTEKAAEAEAMRHAAQAAQREAARIIEQARRDSIPCGGCGVLVTIKDYRCDDCRTEGTDADQFTRAGQGGPPTFGGIGMAAAVESAQTHRYTLPLPPKIGGPPPDSGQPASPPAYCRGGCGAPTPPGISYCGACRSRPLAPLPINTRAAAGQGVRNGR